MIYLVTLGLDQTGVMIKMSSFLFSLTGDTAYCPHCDKIAEGTDIINKFGLRRMGNGVLRVQSWCKSCRNGTGDEYHA
jgi:hypothetical protein